MCKEGEDCKDDPYIPDPKPDCTRGSENYPDCIKPSPNKCKNGELIYPKCKEWDKKCEDGSLSWPGCKPGPNPCDGNPELPSCVKFCQRYPDDKSCNPLPPIDKC